MGKRKRINLNAIASSEDYVASKRRHKEYIQQCHKAFMMKGSSVVGEITEDWHPDTVTISVFGKPLVLSWGEYQSLNCKNLGFKRLS